MFGSEVLEVAIGIIFIYILVSILCMAVREGIEAGLKTRAAHLEHAIRQILHDKDGKGLAESFYSHPLIYGLFSGEYKKCDTGERPGMLSRGGDLPSYIPAGNFATVLMDIAARGPATDAVSSDPRSPFLSLQGVRSNVLNIQNQPVQRALLTAIDAAQGDLDKAKKNIEDWYNSAMDRISGQYKRSTQKFIFLIGLALAVLLNINTLTIADYLYRNDAERAAILERAGTAIEDPAYLDKTYDEAKEELSALNLPIGWSGYRFGVVDNPWNDVFSPLLGWLLTALAATLGAPFWFDVLNKVMVIRSTVKPREKSQEEASEDRQIQSRQAPDVVTLQTAEAAAAPPAAAVLPALPQEVPSPRDQDSSVCGCDVPIVDVTSDEDLPAAQGGVA